MSVTNPLLVEVSANLTDNVEIDLSYLSAQGNWQLTATTVDGGGNSITGDGNASVEVTTVAGIDWEPLYQSDGTTQEQFAFADADRTIIVEDTPVDKVRIVPDGSATLGAGYRVAVYEAS